MESSKNANAAVNPAPQATEKEAKILSNNLFLSAGVYFGHRTQNWNPKMAKYIHSKRKGIHIIDVSKTMKALELTYKIINQAASKGASFVFVGTKKHAKEIVKEEALRSNSFFVSERWLGGTLTNSRTIFSRIKRLEELESQKEAQWPSKTKKEITLLEKELLKLQMNFEGIREMRQTPNFMIVIDPNHDKIAVKEARKSGVKIIGVVDTDGDPDLVDLAIPANDDSIKSIKLILTVLTDAIITAKGHPAKLAYKGLEEWDELGTNTHRPNRDENQGQRRRFDNNNDSRGPRTFYKKRNNDDNNQKSNTSEKK